MTSPGQSDRMIRLIEQLRNEGWSLIDAVRMAEEQVKKEHEQALAVATHARRVSGRTMNDTEMDLMCRGDVAGVARLQRIREIERQHAGRK
jgi:hypothetical protein